MLFCIYVCIISVLGGFALYILSQKDIDTPKQLIISGVCFVLMVILTTVMSIVIK